MLTFDNCELAWCAGFFDGEGSSFSFIGNDGHTVICVSIGQKDPDRTLLERFQRNIGGFGLLRNHGKVDFYALRFRNFEHSQYVMCLLWKWLGPIKRKQYKEASKFYLSECYKPKFDRSSLRKRESSKYGSRQIMKLSRRNKWLSTISDKPFANLFVKIEGKEA